MMGIWLEVDDDDDAEDDDEGLPSRHESLKRRSQTGKPFLSTSTSGSRPARPAPALPACDDEDSDGCGLEGASCCPSLPSLSTATATGLSASCIIITPDDDDDAE